MLAPEEDSEESLTIGGGFNGQYILTITFDNEKFYTLMYSIYNLLLLTQYAIIT